MLLDRQLRFVDANHVYLQLTAKRLDEIIGHSVFELFPNDPTDPNNRSAMQLRQSFEKVLRTGERDVIAFLPYRVARVPGGALEDRYWSTTHSPVRDERNEVAFILQHTMDVTELYHLRTVTSSLGLPRVPDTVAEMQVLTRAQRVQADNVALDLELKRLRQMFEQAPGFICFLRGPDHVFELSNQAYYDLVGRRDLLGKSIREALPDLAGQGFYELLDKVYSDGQPFVGRQIPVVLTRSPGGPSSTITVDFVYQPIFGSDGRAIGILVQGNDVTEASRSEVRHRFLARASEHFIDATDSEQVLRKVASSAVEQFADWCWIDLFQPDQTLRRLIAACANPAWQPLAEEAYRFVPQGAQVEQHPTLGRTVTKVTLIPDFTEDMAQRLARGPEHLAWIHAIGLRSVLGLPLNSRGQRLGVITFGLSQMGRRFDEQDKSSAEELARMLSTMLDNVSLSRERAELLQREQAARERAEAANQAKDEFLAMLGHELRNPLSPILTAVQLLKLRGDAGSARECVIIERQAQHLVRLVDDLLDVSRITRGKVELRKQPTDIAAVINSAVEIASPLLEQKRHRLHLDVGRQLYVDGDAVRLSQVIANLLTNAARYTSAGGDIHVTAALADGAVVVKVRDNGIGIPAELLPRVFDLFVQGQRHSHGAQGGLGLGLTLVRTLVGMHGGTVRAESAGQNAGSAFTVRLPALSPAAVTSARREPAASAPAVGPGQRILIVDDNVDAGQLLSETLREQGHTTALAHDGPSALSLARAFQPELAILDIGLPVMDGYELATQLRATLGTDAPRMIALTGYGQEHDHQRSRDAGFIAHLVKPVDAHTLLQVIESASG
jgi:signal transduction histidine kinase